MTEGKKTKRPLAALALRFTLSTLEIKKRDLAEVLGMWGELEGRNFVPKKLTISAVSQWLSGASKIPHMRLAQSLVFCNLVLDVKTQNLKAGGEFEEAASIGRVCKTSFRIIRNVEGITELEKKLKDGLLQSLLRDAKATEVRRLAAQASATVDEVRKYVDPRRSAAT